MQTYPVAVGRLSAVSGTGSADTPGLSPSSTPHSIPGPLGSLEACEPTDSVLSHAPPSAQINMKHI